jgi:flagellar M-ring protein FliF
MDWGKKLWEQLREVFGPMPPAMRLTTVLLLAVLVVSLGMLVFYRPSGPRTYLLGGESFSSAELTAMEAAFAQEGLRGYEIVGGKVRVPSGRQNDFIAALAKHNALPANFGEILDRALDKGSPYEPRDRRQERIKNAKQVVLSQFISSMRGIERAMVMYDVVERGGLNRERLITAAVIVKPEGTAALDPALAQSIRMMVVAAIAGLQPKDVAITDVNTGQTTFGEASPYGSPLQDPYFARKRLYEQQLKEDILRALAMVPGVTVTPYVELDPEQFRREEQIKHDPKTVEYQTLETTRTVTRQHDLAGGRPGYVAQQGANVPLRLGASGTTRQEQEEESQRSQLNVVSSQIVRSERVGLIPKRVSVAVTIPSSYFRKIWQERYPPSGGAASAQPDPAQLDAIRAEVITNIKQLVAAVLPKPEGVTDPTQLVTVAEFQDLPPPPLPSPPWSTLVLQWLDENWKTLGIIVLMAATLWLLARGIKGVNIAAGKTASAGESPATQAVGTSPTAEVTPTSSRLGRFQTKGASLRQELAQVVAEDPTTAVEILRAWISGGKG